MSYVFPAHVRFVREAKRGRYEYHRVENFLNEEEAKLYEDLVQERYWGYGPSSRSEKQTDGTFTVYVNMWDSCD